MPLLLIILVSICLLLCFFAFFSLSTHPILFFFFFFNDTATTEIYTLSLHDALPISSVIPALRLRVHLRAAGACQLGYLSATHQPPEMDPPVPTLVPRHFGTAFRTDLVRLPRRLAG